jgi:hypothetical protein
LVDLSKDREEEGYLQNLPSGLRDLFGLSLLGIPSIGSLTSAWLTLKALYEIG